MSAKFRKYKLLLDENMPARRRLPLLNRLFDVKHIAFDLRKGGLPDAAVYKEAVSMQRLIITFNGKDFKALANKSQATGIIYPSNNLTNEQLDTKLVALLVRRSPHALFGKFTALTGETES
jgi:predicted nuclease of predicted toxin-antitoxin system